MTIEIDTAIASLDIEAALPHLSEQRRERVLAMKSEEQRRQSVAAYLLLCRATGVEAPVFTYNEHGKPSIAGRPDVHFSMSHCREAVAVAVADRPVGIDIERADRRVSDALMRYAMNDDELRQIASSPTPSAAFVRLWTMKEALVKMTGLGIQSGLRDIIALHPDATFTTHRRDGYICTVCH